MGQIINKKAGGYQKATSNVVAYISWSAHVSNLTLIY